MLERVLHYYPFGNSIIFDTKLKRGIIQDFGIFNLNTAKILKSQLQGSKMEFSIVILAAGAGSRMHSPKPKVLHTICGIPMIDRILYQALQVSDDIHIVLYHHKEKITQHLYDNFAPYFEQDSAKTISLHTQDHKQFPGTGGALLDSTKHIFALKHKRVVVLNGDTPMISAASITRLANVPAPIAVSVLELENPYGYGRILFKHPHNLDNKNFTTFFEESKELFKTGSQVSDSANFLQIERIIEQKDCSEQECAIKIVNAGIYAFDKEVLDSILPQVTNNNAQQEYYLTDVITISAKNNTLIAPFWGNKSEFIGINSKYELAYVESKRLEYLRKQAMEQGVIMHLPETIYIEEDVEFVGECEIENNVRICGKSKIIHSHIRSGSVIEESIIDSSDIGPMAHIRPKSHIIKTHIGNFVETKNAFMEGVKAGHLSYLGDCDIGQGSNIGAGVITCNYDGKQKHKTTIGKNVFVGSDSQLVAPVCIESDTLIAAGSTITTRVRSGDLAISRIKQENRPQFYYRFFQKS